jgi:hypothetical protein
MIGQNRQTAFQQGKADQDYGEVNNLLVENTDLTRAIDQLTREVHQLLFGEATASSSDH